MPVSQIIDIITFNLKILLYFNCFDKELLLVEVINNYFKDTTWSLSIFSSSFDSHFGNEFI